MSRFTQYRSHKYFKRGLILAAFVGCFLVYRIYVWSNTESTDNAYLEADISNVSSEVSGVIDEILVEENNHVKAGEIIAKIKNDNYAAMLAQAESALDGAARDIEIIAQNIKLAEIEQAKTKEAFDFAETNLNLTQVDYDRIQKLSKGNFASRQDLDNTKIALEKAKNEFSQAKLNVQTTLEKLALLEIQKLAAIAKHNNATQETILAKRNFDNTVIRAPIGGIVGNSSLELGNYIRTGVVLFSIVPEKLYVKANFKETQIGKFKAGQEALLKFDSQPGYTIIGHIRNVSPATGSKFSLLPPANATGNFTKIVQRVPVLIDFEIPEGLMGRLTPGMSTIVSIRSDQS
jgi:membrane fusion protein (multidrug efflux system)